MKQGKLSKGEVGRPLLLYLAKIGFIERQMLPLPLFFSAQKFWFLIGYQYHYTYTPRANLVYFLAFIIMVTLY